MMLVVDCEEVYWAFCGKTGQQT